MRRRGSHPSGRARPRGGDPGAVPRVERLVSAYPASRSAERGRRPGRHRGRTTKKARACAPASFSRPATRGPGSVELLRSYCNRDETTRQTNGLVAEARGQIRGAARRRPPRPPHPARAGKHLPAAMEHAIVTDYQAEQTMKEIAAQHPSGRGQRGARPHWHGEAPEGHEPKPGRRGRSSLLSTSLGSRSPSSVRSSASTPPIRAMLLRHGMLMRDSHGRDR